MKILDKEEDEILGRAIDDSSVGERDEVNSDDGTVVSTVPMEGVESDCFRLISVIETG